MENVRASYIAEFLDSDLIGKDMLVTSVSSISSPKKNSLMFAKKTFDLEDNISILLLCKKDDYKKSNKNKQFSYIFCANPRLAFAKVVEEFFVHHKEPTIHKTAIISDKSHIHSSVSIGAYCIIGPGVKIGEGTHIKNNVVVSENVKIGKFCYIKSGSVIGEDGFGFEFEEDKTPVRIPHLGSVEIGDYVEIGSNATIARGTLANTVIVDHVKIDDQVFVAHNAIINQRSLLIACSQVSGSVEIGENVWIGPNASIIQKTKIKNDATIGIGTTVTSDVGAFQKIMGISGMPLRVLVKFLKQLKV
jgi:UDP-3-O-[3-hydroxymyristoyl] glucosamine N-acyltransferase